jgi:HK97 family phage major capsid protein
MSGPRIVDMPRGNLVIPGMATGSAATYVGENANIALTEPTFRDVTLSAKKLAAIVPISNDMLRFPTMNADRFVQEDLVAALAQKMDLVMLRSAGTAFEPKGLRQYALDVAGENVFNANATVNLTNVTTDLGKMELALHNANMPAVRPTWIMSWRSKVFLGNIRDGNGNFAFPEVNASMTLRGKPIRCTTQIPTNLGGGTNESEIYLVEFSQFIVGESTGMEVSVADGAAYHNGSAVISGFSQDQTAIRALVQHDTGLRQLAAVVLMQAVLF